MVIIKLILVILVSSKIILIPDTWQIDLFTVVSPAAGNSCSSTTDVRKYSCINFSRLGNPSVLTDTANMDFYSEWGVTLICCY